MKNASSRTPHRTSSQDSTRSDQTRPAQPSRGQQIEQAAQASAARDSRGSRGGARTEQSPGKEEQLKRTQSSASEEVRETVAHEEIARRAHELWEQDGRPEGRDREHWLEAEKQLRGSSFRGAADFERGDAHAQARAIKEAADRREAGQSRN